MSVAPMGKVILVCVDIPSKTLIKPMICHGIVPLSFGMAFANFS